MCDKDGGGQDSEIVVDKDVCEMWKMCVRCVTKMVVDADEWWTKMCVRCVTKMVVDKIVVDEDVCEMCCVKDDV